MPGSSVELLCYNRGCGQKYDPNKNKEDSCRHHPGFPFFHDAYKGWLCCNKKCTDFTEFLNIEGCTVSFHSNVKPPEPEKPNVDEAEIEETIKSAQAVLKPIADLTVVRPLFDASLTVMKLEIAPSMLQQMKIVQVNNVSRYTNDGTVIQLETPCKNSGCNTVYEGPHTNRTDCVHHPGVPIFHEGLKFWSCCQKRTSDFNTFLNQPGCETGKHLWFKERDDDKKITCRWDWHQTLSHVIVSIYAKQYCTSSSIVRLNPIRLKATVVFPKENNAEFNMDLELRGTINVAESIVTMHSTKVEVKMRKAEPGSWPKLDFPRETQHVVENGITNGITNGVVTNGYSDDSYESLTPQIEAVDLSDL